MGSVAHDRNSTKTLSFASSAHRSGPGQLRDVLIRMMVRLQETLDDSEIVNVFSDELASIVGFTNLSYVDEHGNEKFSTGTMLPGYHSCSYNLLLKTEELGELKISRPKAFSEQELEQIESALAYICHPLRNARQFVLARGRSTRDILTGLHNRLAFEQALEREVDLYHRNYQSVSVLLIDLDNFKSINDEFGHSAGDELLREVAQTISDSVRKTDMVCRYGGEMFVVLLNHTDGGSAMMLAEQIRAKINNTCFQQTEEKFIALTASIGVATVLVQDSRKKLVRRAWRAMYLAKKNGRNRSQFQVLDQSSRLSPI